MSRLSQNALLLLRLDILSSARRGVLGKVFGERHISMRTALMVKIATVVVWVGVTCGIPLLTLTDCGATTELGQSLIRYQHLIINGAVVVMFYIGLFLGANLIYELNISENDQLLSQPIVMEDLVHYRVMDLYRMVLLFCLYIVSPFACLMFLAQGWPIIWTAAMIILTAILFFSVCLLGINAILSVAKRLPQSGSDGICITLFLISGWLFVIAVRAYKEGFFGPVTMPVWGWFNQRMSVFSYASLMDGMVSRPWGIGQYLLGLAFGAWFLKLLSRLSVRTIGHAFERLHVHAQAMTVREKRSAAKLGFRTLNRLLRFIPLDIRTLLVKDLLALVRRPRMLVNVLVFVVFLILLANWTQSTVADPVLLVMYCSSTFVVSRLFLNAIGQERGNILNIKQLMPSVARYLTARTQITFWVSLAVLVPFWGVFIGVSESVALLGAVWRLPLMLLNVLVTSLLVTWYSAAFAEFTSDQLSKHDLGIHPVAMLAFWGLGLLVSYFFYKLDLSLVAVTTGESTTVLLGLMAVLIAAATAAFRYMAIRRIKNYA